MVTISEIYDAVFSGHISLPMAVEIQTNLPSMWDDGRFNPESMINLFAEIGTDFPIDMAIEAAGMSDGLKGHKDFEDILGILNGKRTDEDLDLAISYSLRRRNENRLDNDRYRWASINNALIALREKRRSGNILQGYIYEAVRKAAKASSVQAVKDLIRRYLDPPTISQIVAAAKKNA